MITVSTAPPTPTASEALLDPALNQDAPYVSYEENGRIKGGGRMGFGIIQMLRIQGQRLAVGFGETATHWIDVETGSVEIVERPVLDVPAELTAAAMEEAVIPDLPPCTVSFDGPQTGSQVHEGGDLAIGFVVPGTYRLSAEPFPYRAFALTMTVTE